MFGDGVPHLLVNHANVLHEQPEIPTTFAQEQEELEQVRTAALIPVPRVQPNAGFIQEDAAELGFVVDIAAHAQADQVISRRQIGQEHQARISVVTLAELFHANIDVHGHRTAGL
ncbi:hypothetical protein D3C78_1459340 [compost metagenome]